MEMHEDHVRFATKLSLNKLDHLFHVLDALDPAFRDKHLMKVFDAWVGVQFDIPPDVDESNTTLNELRSNAVNVNVFKRQLQEIVSRGTSAVFVVQSVVLTMLARAYHAGNEDLLEWFEGNERGFMESLARDLSNSTNESEKEELRRMIEGCESNLAALPKGIQDAREVYERLCEEVAKPLLQMGVHRRK